MPSVVIGVVPTHYISLECPRLEAGGRKGQGRGRPSAVLARHSSGGSKVEPSQEIQLEANFQRSILDHPSEASVL